jgi:hypothetical protein
MTGRTRAGLWLGILLSSVVWCGSGPEDGAERLLPCAPAQVELNGLLTVQQELGPPGFGATPKIDMKLDVPVLLLAQPIGMQGDPSDELNGETITGIRKVQLSVLPLSTTEGYTALVGQQVVVVGTLAAASLGTHFTPVVLDASEIRAFAPAAN